jgi:hypothetical protein
MNALTTQAMLEDRYDFFKFWGREGLDMRRKVFNMNPVQLLQHYS